MVRAITAWPALDGAGGSEPADTLHEPSAGRSGDVGNICRYRPAHAQTRDARASQLCRVLIDHFTTNTHPRRQEGFPASNAEMDSEKRQCDAIHSFTKRRLTEASKQDETIVLARLCGRHSYALQRG